MDLILFTLNLIAPTFLMVLLGILLKKVGVVTDTFAPQASAVVFNVALPMMIFIKLASVNLTAIVNFQLLGFCYGLFLIFYGASWLWIRSKTQDGKTIGAFVQGSFRSNYGIVGLAFAALMMDDVGFGKAALLLAAIIPLNNILAVIALKFPQKDQHVSWIRQLKSLATNPLIIAMAIASVFSINQWPVAHIVKETGDYLAALTLPLALISIGASMTFSHLKSTFRLAVIASTLRNIVFPVIALSLAIWLGFRGDELIQIFLLFATPSAVAGYIMAQALKSNHALAGAIVMISTLASSVTMGLGIYLLKAAHLI